MISAQITSDRVREHTPDETNRQIDANIEKRVNDYRDEPRDRIIQRILELDREWDIERTLELNASLLAFTGVVMAATGSRKWLILPLAVTGFLAQHAIQGWCPPLALFRKLKIRTRKEIDAEKHALMHLLGD